MRTFLAVPMLKENELIGAFVFTARKFGPSPTSRSSWSQNFAAQAVIAIENARLLNELRQRTTDLTERTADLTEALEQQTATSEVLQVISSSPGDLEPVFATMLENAVRICDAKFGNIYRWDGELYARCDAQHPACFGRGTQAFTNASFWSKKPCRPHGQNQNDCPRRRCGGVGGLYRARSSDSCGSGLSIRSKSRSATLICIVGIGNGTAGVSNNDRFVVLTESACGGVTNSRFMPAALQNRGSQSSKSAKLYHRLVGEPHR